MGQHDESFDFIGHLSGDESGNAQVTSHSSRTAVEGRYKVGAPKVVITQGDGETPTVVNRIPDEMPVIHGAAVKAPTPLSDWRPEWKPRKRLPGKWGSMAKQAAVEAVCGKLKIEPEALAALPRNEFGEPTKSEQLFAALKASLVAGGTLTEFADAVGLPRYTIQYWINRTPEWADDLEEAKRLGADALVERALSLAENPQLMEDVTESYDEAGRLVSKFVRRGDAVVARKLAVSTFLDIAKKWAPDKYGDKLEVKTNDTLATRIMAARRRSSRESAEVIDAH